ncbi:hypothetical protein V6N13_024799 [Hibiscus sabdariffa]
MDASFDVHIGKAAIGIVARDSDGFVLKGKTLVLEGSHIAETVIAYAFQEGVQLAVDSDWKHAIVEGDAIHIVHRLANSGLDLSTSTAILNITRQRLRSNPGFKVHYVKSVGT